MQCIQTVSLFRFISIPGFIDPFPCEKIRKIYCVMAAILVVIIVQAPMDKCPEKLVTINYETITILFYLDLLQVYIVLLAVKY